MLNNDLDDNKRLFHDMQEHPEQYSDEQLEAMMADIDSEPDTEAAWKRLENGKRLVTTTSSHRKMKSKAEHRWMRVAAIFIGVLAIAGIAVAAIHILYSRTEKQVATVVEASERSAASEVPNTEPVHFDNVTLDSILTVVATHYHKAVSFRDEAPRRMKLIMTWLPDQTFAE